MTFLELFLGLVIAFLIAIYFYAKYKHQGFLETLKELTNKISL
jgi:hypothetical protein